MDTVEPAVQTCEQPADTIADDVESIRKMLMSRPNWAPAHFALAQTFERRGDSSEAIESYRRTIEIKPHCVEAHERLAALLTRLGRFAEARRHYEQVVALAPARHDVHNNLGAVLQELGETEAAKASYKRALELAPDCLEAHVNLAAAQTKLRQFDAAAANLEPPSLAFFVPKGSEGIFLRGMGGVLTRLTPGRFRTTIVCAPSGIEKVQAALGGSSIELLPLAATLVESVNRIHTERFDLAYFWEVGTD